MKASCEQAGVYIRNMTLNRILNVILSLLLMYNTAFFVLHLTGQSRVWKDALSDIQALLSIMELIAVVALFVDLVIRFDDIATSWQLPRVVGVGACVAGLLFKWFILYLHLSYLVD